jgi:hypothetical protein
MWRYKYVSATISRFIAWRPFAYLKFTKINLLKAALYPQEDSGHSFLLEAESTPGPQCGWKD